jgi:hypothetical protein
MSVFFFSVVCCQVKVSTTGRSLVQRHPTECGVFHWVWSWSPGPLGAVAPWRKENSLVQMYIAECWDGWSNWNASTKPCQWIGAWIRVMGELPKGNFSLLSVVVRKGWGFSGQQVVLLTNEDFGPCTVRHENFTAVQGARTQHMKHSRICGTLTEIQDIQVAKLWRDDRTQYHMNFLTP